MIKDKDVATKYFIDVEFVSALHNSNKLYTIHYVIPSFSLTTTKRNGVIYP